MTAAAEDAAAAPLAVCPHCGGRALQGWGLRTSRGERGAYAGWTTTTRRYGCAVCGAVTSLTTRVPPAAAVPHSDAATAAPG